MADRLRRERGRKTIGKQFAARRPADVMIDQRALVTAREIPSPVGEMRVSYTLGKMHEAMGSPPEALEHYRRAHELATELGVASYRKAAAERMLRPEPAEKQWMPDEMSTPVS